MYSPSLSRYARAGGPPAPAVGSAPHRVGPPHPPLRAYDPDGDDDDDDELLSANELVKTLQPPPAAGRSRPQPPRNAMEGPHASLGAPTRQGAARTASLTPHDYFQPPQRLPRDADWHTRSLPYADVGLDGLPVGPPVPRTRGKYPMGPSSAHAHPLASLDELSAEQSRARAYELMMEHQRQAHYHTQMQLRHYQQQHPSYATGGISMHEQQLMHRQRQQQAAAAAAAGPRGYFGDDAGRGDGPMVRRRGGMGRSAPVARGGFEHAHRIHRELQPPPTYNNASRHYSSPVDVMPGMSMSMASAGRSSASARRRGMSPASPDFDPQFDLLPFDPSGMDLYDAGGMSLGMDAASSLDMQDELLGRGGSGPNNTVRRMGRPASGPPRRGPAPPTSAASPLPPRDQSRAYPARYEDETEGESSSARPARTPPSEASQGAAKRPKLDDGAKPTASEPNAAGVAPSDGSSGASSVKRRAPGKAPKANRAKTAGGSSAKSSTSEPAASTAATEGAGAGADAKEAAGEEEGDARPAEPKRRCGRKSMNYSSEQKRERNRAAVKKCRQRQALKLEYLQHKGEVLQAENQALSDMVSKNVELDEAKSRSLTRGIQMDILLKIKEIFTQSLPKDFVLDADSIWDLNSVLAVSMPSRCYYGIESIKDFWRTSLRMRNKGKIRSFWAWLFRLPPGDRFSEFTIEPFSPTSSLYFISWTTKSDPPLAGSMVIMFGHGHRVTLHVECFGWLIWRYLLTNEPFPEPPVE